MNSSLSRRLRFLGLLSFAAVLAFAPAVRATVLSGSFAGISPYPTSYNITDGTNSAQFIWSEYAFGSSAYVYSTTTSDVALAAGVTDVRQITNASAYTFVTGSLNHLDNVLDAAANGGIGQFVLVRSHSGYYAVVRFDDVLTSTLNATWWFQGNGSSDFSSFVQPAGSLGSALNATNFTWITNGSRGWFAETTNTHDGVSAAQSGAITDSQVSGLQTTVSSNGTISFYWKVSSEEDADFLNFYINGSLKNAITGEVDWNQQSYPVSAGDLLRWEYNKDGSDSEGLDAGWVDQVTFAPPTVVGPVSATFDLVLTRSDNDLNGIHNHGYGAIPELTSITPAPVTTHQVQSSDGLIYGVVNTGNTNWSTSGSTSYPTLDALIFACTNAPWTLIINQGDASEEEFQFNVSITALTTNQIRPVPLLTPVLNATNVATNTLVQWAGPAGYSSIFINAYALPAFASVGQASLPGSATNWPSPPVLNYGSNGVTLVMTSNNFPNLHTTTPMMGATPISSWSSTADLQIVTETPFTVGQPAPLPVQLTGSPPQAGGGSFQLGFQTLAGRPETIQMRTNLTLGTWVDVTNFIGDGNSQQFNFPTTNPGAYYRVISR